ncbi:MAG: hypothetical protein KGV44_01945 [Flavobacteriaceae bacterium]|nr:hypothetical protein [Flavobacteriaceae bacterium]
MKYSRSKTITHPISTKHKDCVKDFNNVILNEDDSLNTKPSIFNNVEVINTDCVEKERVEQMGGGDRNRTMDVAFAIAESSDCEISEIIFVELKLNCINPNNLKRGELKGKVLGSTNLFSSSTIYKDYIIVVQPNKLQQTKSILNKLRFTIPDNFIPMDINELKRTFF